MCLSLVSYFPLTPLLTISTSIIPLFSFVFLFQLTLSNSQRALIVAALEDVVSVFLVLPNISIAPSPVIISPPFSYLVGGIVS